jgi:hypothetical protein
MVCLRTAALMTWQHAFPSINNLLQTQLQSTIVPSAVRPLRRFPVIVRVSQLEGEVIQKLRHQNSHLNIRKAAKGVS